MSTSTSKSATRPAPVATASFSLPLSSLLALKKHAPIAADADGDAAGEEEDGGAETTLPRQHTFIILTSTAATPPEREPVTATRIPSRDQQQAAAGEVEWTLVAERGERDKEEEEDEDVEELARPCCFRDQRRRHPSEHAAATRPEDEGELGEGESVALKT